MFNLTIGKEQLITPLLTVAGAVDKKQSMPILSNVLIEVSDKGLSLTATDLEIEMTANVSCQSDANVGAITVPAKKFVDIIRSLEENADIRIACDTQGVKIKQHRSSFKLAALPADDYPNSDDEVSQVELTLKRTEFIQLLQSTHFAMSQQDVRIFLNGLLLEINAKSMTTVATDGHRMAICKMPLNTNTELKRLLLPRKGVQEILRLLNNIQDETVLLTSGNNHFKLITSQYTFVSKLIDARFPLYEKAIPKHQDKSVVIQRDVLKRALARIIILAHEKSHGITLHIETNQLTLIANNQEQEEAIETLEAETEGGEIKIGVNASYLLDVLNYFEDSLLRLSMKDADSSILVESLSNEHYQYIIMPMRI